jgi:hypothetical protein
MHSKAYSDTRDPAGDTDKGELPASLRLHQAGGQKHTQGVCIFIVGDVR